VRAGIDLSHRAENKLVENTPREIIYWLSFKITPCFEDLKLLYVPFLGNSLINKVKWQRTKWHHF
jgi:hypothetical protein